MIACYQYAHFLGEALDSIVALSLRPRQVTLIDDGSSDDPLAVAERYRRALEGGGTRLRTVRHATNRGLATARNTGIGCTPCEWILCLDADDRLKPHALEELATHAAAADVVMFGYEAFGSTARGPARGVRLYQRHPDLIAAFRAGKRLGTACSPFRRGFWERSPYDDSVLACEDTALWLRFARLGARFEVSRRPCVEVRQHPDRMSFRVVAPNRAAIMRQLHAIADAPPDSR